MTYLSITLEFIKTILIIATKIITNNKNNSNYHNPNKTKNNSSHKKTKKIKAKIKINLIKIIKYPKLITNSL